MVYNVWCAKPNNPLKDRAMLKMLITSINTQIHEAMSKIDSLHFSTSHLHFGAIWPKL